MSDDTSKLLKACVEYRAMVDKLERDNATLRADKERLDWLAVSNHWFDLPEAGLFTPQTFRAAIDAVRKSES